MQCLWLCWECWATCFLLTIVYIWCNDRTNLMYWRLMLRLTGKVFQCLTVRPHNFLWRRKNFTPAFLFEASWQCCGYELKLKCLLEFLNILNRNYYRRSFSHVFGFRVSNRWSLSNQLLSVCIAATSLGALSVWQLELQNYNRKTQSNKVHDLLKYEVELALVSWIDPSKHNSTLSSSLNQ